jgi:hypothetical protein
MGVDVVWRNEQGGSLGEVLDPEMSLSRHVGSPAWAETTCLRFVDPYGDTIFNQRQIPVLVRELEESVAFVTDTAIKRQLSDVIQLLKQAVGKTHTYAWFIGD